MPKFGVSAQAYLLLRLRAPTVLPLSGRKFFAAKRTKSEVPDAERVKGRVQGGQGKYDRSIAPVHLLTTVPNSLHT